MATISMKDNLRVWESTFLILSIRILIRVYFLQVYIVKSLGIIVFLPDVFLLPFITKSSKPRF